METTFEQYLLDNVVNKKVKDKKGNEFGMFVKLKRDSNCFRKNDTLQIASIQKSFLEETVLYVVFTDLSRNELFAYRSHPGIYLEDKYLLAMFTDKFDIVVDPAMKKEKS